MDVCINRINSYYFDFAFFGRPTGFGFFNLSTIDGSYMLVRPTLRTGSMPNRAIRLLMVWNGSPKIPAISKTVNSSTLLISVNIPEKLSDVNEKTVFTTQSLSKIQEKSDLFSTLSLKILDNLGDIAENKSIRQLNSLKYLMRR